MKVHYFTVFGRWFGFRRIKINRFYQPMWGYSRGILYCGKIDFYLGYKPEYNPHLW